MSMPLDKLPITYEELRSLILEALRQLDEDSNQLVGFYSKVGRLAAVARKIVADPNGPNPDRHAVYILDRHDQARVQDILWDLIIEGIVRPGLGTGGGNDDLPFFHVTDFGNEQIAHGPASPYDPDGYLQRLMAAMPKLDGVIVTYLNESLRTFRIGCLLSSAVTLGCASEQGLLLLIEAYARALSPAKATQFRKKTAGKFIKTQLDEFDKMLPGHLRAQLPPELDDGLVNILLGVSEMIRMQRNVAGHPTGKVPSRAELSASIAVFPRYLKRVYDLIGWLDRQGPGTL
jgi:hypothetical protein